MGSALEVASLFATLRLDDQLTGGLQGVQRGLDGMGRSLQNAGAQVSMITAPIAGAFAFGISTASSFQGIMAEVQARAGLTADEMSRVSDFALQMGADTAFSGQQAGEAFLQLLTSGQSVEEAFITLPAVLDAAAASGEDLGSTADDVTDIMAMFGLGVQAVTPEMQALFDAAGLTDDAIAAILTEGDSGVPILNELAESTGLTAQALYEIISAEDAASVVESLARAAGASSASMGDLSDGFKNVGAVAHRFGLSANRTAAVLAVLAENGIKGAEGGTALRSMLMNMTRPTEAVAGAWNELGVSFYNADGSTRDLAVIMDELGASLDALPTEQQNRLMYELTGTYGTSALSALLAADSIRDMEEAMDSAASVSDVARARMNTFDGATDSLKGSIETLMINALTPLMENVLTPMVQKLTDVVNGIGDWVNANPELTGQIVLLAGGAVLLGPAMMLAGTGLRAAATAVGLLNTAVGLLTSPIVLVAGAFLAILHFGGRLEPLFNDLKGIFEGPFADGVRKVGDALQILLGSVNDGQRFFGLAMLSSGLTTIKDALVSMVGLTFDNLVQALENITGLELSDGLAQIGEFLTQAAQWAGTNVLQPIIDGFNGLATGVQGFFETLGEDVDPAAIQTILDTVVKVGEAIVTIAGALLQVGGETIGATLSAVGDALPGLASGIADLINTVGGLLSGDIDPAQALSDIGGAIGEVGASLLSIPVGAADGLITALNSLDGEGGINIPTLTEMFNGLKDNVFKPLGEAFQSVVNTLSGAWTLIEPLIQPLVDWFNTTFAAMGEEDGAIDIISKALDSIVTLIEGIWDAVSPGLNALATGFQTVLGPIVEIINSIITGLESLRGMPELAGQARDVAMASGLSDEELWQFALDAAGGNDLAARIAFGYLIGGRADGGPVSAGMPYVVGERGPELLVPSSNGTIIPNHALGGGGVVVYVNSYGSTPHEFATLIERALRDRGR